MADYVVLLSKDRNSDYGVDFPDFPGCVTAGTTPGEARELAVEALCLHIEGMIEDGEPIPAPSPIERIRSDPAHSDALDILVVSVPDDLIHGGRDREREGCNLSCKSLDA
jgi:predicted RNase H-like HicB family nuclease